MSLFHLYMIMNTTLCLTAIHNFRVKGGHRQGEDFQPWGDKISVVLFKGLSELSMECLLSVYNSIWHSGNIPSRRIMHYLLCNKILECKYLGFLPFRDCHTLLAILHQDISNAKNCALGMSLDLQDAYASINIDSLIYKSAQVDITGQMLRWIH